MLNDMQASHTEEATWRCDATQKPIKKLKNHSIGAWEIVIAKWVNRKQKQRPLWLVAQSDTDPDGSVVVSPF